MINPTTTAVLMIDMQNGFIDAESSLCVAGAQGSIANCADVLATARAANIDVFHIRREYAADGSDVEPVRHEIWLKGGRPLCKEGYDPESLNPPAELEPIEGEHIVFKPRFSAFFDTDLHATLNVSGIDTVVLIGTTTPNCIRTTCYDGLSLNYHVIVIDDATSSRTPEVQQANIADMEYIGATIMTTKAFREACGCDHRSTSNYRQGSSS